MGKKIIPKPLLMVDIVTGISKLAGKFFSNKANSVIEKITIEKAGLGSTIDHAVAGITGVIAKIIASPLTLLSKITGFLGGFFKICIIITLIAVLISFIRMLLRKIKERKAKIESEREAEKEVESNNEEGSAKKSTGRVSGFN